MEKIEDFLDWLVSLDIKFYVTEPFPDYTPSGKSHFYLNGSPERFTSAEMILIWSNNADNELSQRWVWAMADYVQKSKKR